MGAGSNVDTPGDGWAPGSTSGEDEVHRACESHKRERRTLKLWWEVRNKHDLHGPVLHLHLPRQGSSFCWIGPSSLGEVPGSQ